MTQHVLACPVCKGLLHSPVTLPCGFSLCSACLPALSHNPDNDMDGTVPCPFPQCCRGGAHARDQIQLDVTLHKLTSLVRTTDAAWDNKTTKTLTTEAITQVLPEIRSRVQQEIECQVCFLLFDKPLTTRCGHTFCKDCLLRSLDHHRACPLCRAQLPLYHHFHRQRPNKALTLFIQLLTKLDQSHSKDDIDRKDIFDSDSQDRSPLESALSSTPLFINSLVFPRMPCYLLVFEPRYRRMLRSVLKTESKVFGMVLPPASRKQTADALSPTYHGHGPWEPSMEYGTLLRILSFEPLPDGRSLVETVGLARFQILTYAMVDSFYVATAIDLVHDISADQELALEQSMIETHSRRKQKNATLDVYGSNHEEHQPEEEEEEDATKDTKQQGHRQHPAAKTEDKEAAHLSEDASNTRVPDLNSATSSTSDSTPASSIPVPQSPSTDPAVTALPEPFEMNDIRDLDLEGMTRQQLLDILLSFVGHMQTRLGPMATQRLEREFGTMVADDGEFLSFWVGSILPLRNHQKYALLGQTSVRQRLLTVVGWIREIEARRSMSVCTVS